jgi:hypothetical protein
MENDMAERSKGPQKASQRVPEDDMKTVGDDVSPLLTPESSTTENAGEFADASNNIDKRGSASPLLGTSASDGIETLGKLSSRRSPKRQCYGNLLRFRSTAGSRNPEKTAGNRSTDRYGDLSHQVR